MRLIKIGLANINTTVGAFGSNTEKIIKAMEDMADAKCTLGSFPEQTISGYPAEDLVQWRHFVEGQWEALQNIARATCNLSFPTIFTVGVTVSHKDGVYNTVAVFGEGKIFGIVPKEKLPTYGVFYEGRTFSRGTPGFFGAKSGVPFGDMIFNAPFGVFAVEVCEDIWTPDGPMRRRAMSGAELVINASASPFRVGIVETRREMIATRAADNQVVVAYVNQVGGNDALVFDGGGYINQNGQMLLDAPRWKEGFVTQVIDLDRTVRMRAENTTWRSDHEAFFKNQNPVKEVLVDRGRVANEPSYAYPIPQSKNFFIPDMDVRNPRAEFFDDLIEAMLCGLDYFEKSKVFRSIGIGLSGGKDSALTLVVAYLFAKRRFNGDAELVRNFIHCFSMPTRFNSEATKSIASSLADELGVSFKELPIEEAFVRECEAARAMLRPDEELTPLTIQNIQARVRAARMWNWANTVHGLWLQTGNMSEKAVGYTTIGGDLSGGYSLLGNVPKTLVVELLRYIEEKYAIKSIGELLRTRASAELAESQDDEGDLMPFPVLDACFALFAGEKLSPKEMYRVLRAMWTDEELRVLAPMYEPGMLKEWVKKFVRMFVRSVFKWVQAPEAVHLGSLDLDRERALQLPVVHSAEWLEVSLAELDIEE